MNNVFFNNIRNKFLNYRLAVDKFFLEYPVYPYPNKKDILKAGEDVKSKDEVDPRKSPQAIQGMYQAYGQIKAAFILAIGSVFFAGGVKLWVDSDLADKRTELAKEKSKLGALQKKLKNRNSDLKKSEKNLAERGVELEKKDKDLRQRESYYLMLSNLHKKDTAEFSAVSATAKISIDKLEESEKYIKEICGYSKSKDKCVKKYNDLLAAHDDKYEAVLNEVKTALEKGYEETWKSHMK